MNKIRWISLYLRHLQDHGLEPIQDNSLNDRLEIRANNVKGSSLDDINYHVLGYWYRPTSTSDHFEKTDFMRVWRSFIVQSLDITPVHSLILIDTSVCDNAFGKWLFLSRNAGQHSCIGKEQFEVIKEVAARAKDRKMNLIFSGHFPLKNLKPDERTRLINIMSSASDKWMYVSGHTHDGLSINSFSKGDGIDVNIGSTTDWPMEGHVIYLDKSASRAAYIQPIRSSDTMLTSKKARFHTSVRYSSSELCRHLNVAEKLAGLTKDDFNRSWVRPKRKRCEFDRSEDKDKWRIAFDALSHYQHQIVTRSLNEDEYRNYVLDVAAQAAKKESRWGRWTIP